PGNYSKAYSIGSLLYPIANVIMVPVAGFIYSSVGPVPLFAGATVLFLITAIVETQIKAHEPHLDMSNEELSNRPKLSASKQFAIDLKTGIDYLKKEKGLFTITAYFFCTMGASAVMSTLFLPYTQSHLEIFKFEIFEKSVVWDATILYSLIMAANTLGRIIGGVFHYKRKIKPEKKFNTALFVYIALSFLDGAVLFMPTWYFMALLQLVSGALAVTSFNIRISATQNYVPDNIRARFNATFQLLNAVGMIIGQLIGGALGEIFDPRFIVMFSMVFNLIAIFAIMYSRRKYVKAIYNCDI
ncbi:MAG: MFS transporter, partial [Clostridia bacterium]